MSILRTKGGHALSLISAFVIRFLGKYNRMLDFSVRLSEQFDSSLTWSETPKLEPRRQISRQGPVNQNQDDLFILGRICGSRGGDRWSGPPPDKAQKCRISSEY